MTRPRAALAAAVLVALALTGCAHGAAAESPPSTIDPTPTPTPTSTPTPTPTPTPAPPTAFGGDCGLVLSAADVSTLMGPATAGVSVAADPAVAAPGALACSWTSASGALNVTAVPAAEVAGAAADRYSLPECSRDTGFCGASATAGGMWLLVDFGWLDGEWEPTVSSTLNAVKRSAAAHPVQ